MATAAVLAAVFCVAPARAGQESQAIVVPLHVQEDHGLPRQDALIAGGVPIPRTAGLADATRLAVVDARGGLQEAQITPLARWNAPLENTSAPLKWVHVALRGHLAANGNADYALTERGEAPETEGADVPPLARRDGSGVRVDTGAISFLIPGDRFAVLEDARLTLSNAGAIGVLEAGHGGGIYVLQTGSDRYHRLAEEDVRVDVESAGPLRAVVRVQGRYGLDAVSVPALGDGRPTLRTLEFDARIVAHRGRSDVGIALTLRYPDRFLTTYHNGDGEPVYQQFDGLALMLPLRTLGNPVLATFGGQADVGTEFPEQRSEAQGPRPIRLGGRTEAYLYQDSSGGPEWSDTEDGGRGTTLRGWIAGAGSESLGRGMQAEGWADVAALGWGATIGMRHFWQNWPKGLRLRADGMVAVDLWPDRFRDPHRLQGGRQKTHELFLDLHAGQQPAADRFRDFANPLHLRVDPSWVRDTLAAGPVSVAGQVEGLDDTITATVAATVRDPGGRDLWGERARQDLYGWRDWGDSYRDGDKTYPAFGNNEFDFGYGLLMQYLRSAEPDRRAMDAAESMFRHLIDIDLYHTERDVETYSLGVRQHDGNGSIEHTRPPLLSHAWTRGLVTWHWLTGDPQARDAALQVGAWIDAMQDDRTGELEYNSQTRSQAWAAQILTDLWELTGQPRWLQMAGQLLHAEFLADQQAPGSSLPCPALDWEGDAGDRQRESAVPWHNGYMAEAIGRYAFLLRLAGSTDAALEDGLVRLLDELATCGIASRDNGRYVAGDDERDDEVYGQRYQALVIDRIYPDGSWSAEYPNNHFLTDGFAYGALLTTDPQRRARYLDLARETWRWTMGPETAPGQPAEPPRYCCPATPAKNTAMNLRFGHAFLWLVERMGQRGPATGGR